ncbi:hypothetical protein [Flagellimonas sp.]
MNRITVVFLLILTCSSAQESNFEGLIKYDLIFEDKTGQMTDDQVVQFMGDSQSYFIKKNKYKSIMNGMLEVTQYYTGNDTIYSEMNGIGSIMFLDTKNISEEVISYKIKEESSIISGYSCDLLEVKSNLGITLYYFNSSIKVNPEDFQNHHYGLWYYCLKKTKGALPIKMVRDIDKSKLIIELTELERKELASEMFEIPKGVPIVKNPSQ